MTWLFTGSVADDILVRATSQFLANEFLQDDVDSFRALAPEPHLVGDLDAATRHKWDRSPRYRDILAPLALGDELPAALRVDGICWGALCQHREHSVTPFTPSEADLLDQLTPHLGAGLRKARLLGTGIAPAALDEPGLLLLADDFFLVATTSVAERWLAEIAAADWPHIRELPTAVDQVAGRLQALERDGDPLTRLMPRVRFRAWSGQRPVLHASRTSGPAGPAPIAVFLEIAPLMIQADDLSRREGEITLYVVRGLSTAESASELHISAHPVQDHLKAIFDRIGVHSRRELMRVSSRSSTDPPSW